MSEIRTSCPGCQAAMKLSDTLAGKKVRCPRCKTSFVVPAAGAEPAAAPSPPRAAEPARSKPAAPPQKPAPQPAKLRRPADADEEDAEFIDATAQGRRPAAQDEEEDGQAAARRGAWPR